MLEPINSLSDDDSVAVSGSQLALVPRDIVDLSDDDDANQALPAIPKREKRRRVSSADFVQNHSKRLQLVIKGKCSCKEPNCRKQWRDAAPAEFDRLLQLRLTVHELPKLDSDEEVLWRNSHLSEKSKQSPISRGHVAKMY